ncbi:MAG: class I SAM-dependent methyltransferase [Candidatus Bathyarchaeia archaeon]
MLDLRFWEIKRKVIKHYDKISRIYNALYGYEQKLKINEILKILHINPLDVILDVGCGTGLLFNYTSDSARFIIGVDISLKILKVAKNLIKKDRLNNVFLIRADADFLPFRDEVFDKVFAITLLQNMPDPILTLHEIARVAKNNSEIIVTGLKKFFSKEDFLRILRELGMATSLIDTDEKIKCYIAMCSKRGEYTGKSINNRIENKMVV